MEYIFYYTYSNGGGQVIAENEESAKRRIKSRSNFKITKVTPICCGTCIHVLDNECGLTREDVNYDSQPCKNYSER